MKIINFSAFSAAFSFHIAASEGSEKWITIELSQI